ncbi:glycosyltransferase family 2 protein [Leptolyngbya sp. 15MV]|nr:glycosyltransferase family 2 protein [Leptolyngbya sp. 15MV]
MTDRTNVVVAVCTYNRHEDLQNLLEKLKHYQRGWTGIRLGVTIVDDSQDGNARVVTEPYLAAFPLGLVYHNSASRNISLARNAALEHSIDRAGWVAMTDDDCEPSEQWLAELVRVQQATLAPVVTGLMVRRAPPHAPEWIKTQPFLDLGEFEAMDGDEIAVAFTNNSLISARFLRENSQLRFDPDLGRIGGEDVTFFRQLNKHGARLIFAANAFVYENEPDDRLTFAYQLRRHLWHGNSSVVTSLYAGQTRPRMAIHSAATTVRALTRPIGLLAKGQKPQLRYCLAQVCEGVGKALGVLGVRIKHR